MSKTLSGGWQIDAPVFTDAKPSQDRTPAPADEVSRFMASNLFYCQLYAARITPKQCNVNRGKKLFLCGKCEQVLLSAPVASQPKRRKRKGDNPNSPWRTEVYSAAEIAKFEASKEPSEKSGQIEESVPLRRAS